MIGCSWVGVEQQQCYKREKGEKGCDYDYAIDVAQIQKVAKIRVTLGRDHMILKLSLLRYGNDTCRYKATDR
jgi:hypothetical protein